MLFRIDVHHLLSQFFPSKTYNIDYISSLNSSITSIVLPNWTCNVASFTTFDFSKFVLLESLEIGNDSFCYVETFIVDGLIKLKTLKIGSNSFTQEKSSYGCNESKSFYVMNCETLQSIEICKYSFSDFAGEFVLRKLPKLETILIGNIEKTSWNFYYCSFVIRGE